MDCATRHHLLSLDTTLKRKETLQAVWQFPALALGRLRLLQ